MISYPIQSASREKGVEQVSWLRLDRGDRPRRSSLCTALGDPLGRGARLSRVESARLSRRATNSHIVQSSPTALRTPEGDQSYDGCGARPLRQAD
jgi:hypothetical protein